ncbi:serine/threonine-protein kinase [Rhodococcus chondri]|uniref:non-specific serine/threonine protein kinase n=1 Tax=Rhodococcus chondri TaxID=3065941 RepID=A0ABU7JLA5_9NOCA|nr:serine/threonine-protein kinase [Rhodococcus sp. CC-R104]MEE2030595.1 serine/threonine-protein kinase [Rhodococcus sp. CC-R104]
MTVHSVLGGRYELSGLLGVGGMGEIYDGWDTRLDRPVAVKMLRREFGSKPDVRQRFEAEARAAATLTHRCIVAVHDTGEHDGRPYIVMERLPGRTLADDIARGPLPDDRVRAVLVDVLEALIAAHDAGILHRDIKPANVLITDSGVKVSDFGIAKSVGDDLTRTGELVGTVAYLSPDRIAGRPAEVTDDLYALGIVGYEALCGRRPFAHDNILSLARVIAYEEPQPLSEARPDADPGLVAVIEQAMARDVSRRFGSARAMLAALEDRTGTYAVAAATRSLPVDDAVTTAPIPVAAGKAGRNDPSRGVVLATALTLIGAIAVGVLALAWGQSSGTPPAATTESRTPGVSASLPQRTQASTPEAVESTTGLDSAVTEIPPLPAPVPVPVTTLRVDPPGNPDNPGNSGNGNGNSGNGNSGNGNSGNNGNGR